ncbi:hypothetical protein [Kitasatospora sp. NPDC002040]|uniref:hypothetical protein n=1 Tax=Kitasatospora sp. NPDC002040 TaxID=3154661 RepID=UPI00331D354B
MTEIGFPWVRRLLLLAVAAAMVLGAGWYCYAWVLPGESGPANSGKVSRASATARAELDRSLAEVLAALPGRPELLGTAELDHCIWPWDFETHDRGGINCQRQQARYLALDGNPVAAGRDWDQALRALGWTRSADRGGSGDVWMLRQDYLDRLERDCLLVTFVRDEAGLSELDNELRLEGTSQYRRDVRKFDGLDAARRALAAGRPVVELSLLRTYYSDGRPIGPPY